MNDSTPTWFNTLIGVAAVVWVTVTGAASMKYLFSSNDRPIIQSMQTCTTFLWGGCNTNNAK